MDELIEQFNSLSADNQDWLLSFLAFMVQRPDDANAFIGMLADVQPPKGDTA